MEVEKSLGISVIICCYNSVSRIGDTLKHLVRQKVSTGFQWEIIIVDNASTDNTAMVAQKWWAVNKKDDIGFRVITQSTPGLIFARHSGVNAAKFEYILFCDDDNWLERNYLATAYDIMTKNPDVGALGGIGTPEVEPGVTPPEWFHKSKGLYALGPQALKTGAVPNNFNLYGAGLVTRQTLYLDSYPPQLPSLLQGRTGTSLTSGEDTEYCFRLRLRNQGLYYSEGLKFKHLIPKERLTENYKNRLLKSTEDSQKQLRRYEQLIHYINTSRPLKLSKLVRTILACLAGKILNRPTWNYNDIIRAVFYATTLNFGIDEQTKKIYNYYNNMTPVTTEQKKNSVTVSLPE